MKNAEYFLKQLVPNLEVRFSEAKPQISPQIDNTIKSLTLASSQNRILLLISDLQITLDCTN